MGRGTAIAPRGAFLCAAVFTGCGTAAFGSPTATVIADQVDIGTYQYYLEDLLYTHLGDDRGFGPEHDLARANILATLTDHGLGVALEPFIYSSQTYYNVVATQPGDEVPGDVYVVGAHFDSANNPGADDNGTGSALVMEVARVLSSHRTSRTIRYVLFDREEQGLRGSSAFVNAHVGDNIIMAVTADMVGHNSGAYGMDIYGTAASYSVLQGVADAIDTHGNGLGAFLNVGSFPFSDHWSFESAGIPACVIIEDCYSCNPYYHTSSDAVDVYAGYIDYAMLEDLVRSVVAYLVDEIGISLYGDQDADADVDMGDMVWFLDCFAAPVSAECLPFDFDRDQDVDLDDYAGLAAVFTGPRR